MRSIQIGEQPVFAGDAVVTAIEASAFNIRRARRIFDFAIVAVSIAAPVFAAAVLAGGIRRHALDKRQVNA